MMSLQKAMDDREYASVQKYIDVICSVGLGPGSNALFVYKIHQDFKRLQEKFGKGVDDHVFALLLSSIEKIELATQQIGELVEFQLLVK